MTGGHCNGEIVYSQTDLNLFGKPAGAPCGDTKINIFAFSIAEANGFGVVRALVDRPEDAHRTLTDLGFRVSFTDVIGVKMRDEPGGLSEVASVLGDAGINIEYAYAYSGRDGAVLILRVDQVEDAVRQILDRGGELLKASLFR